MAKKLPTISKKGFFKEGSKAQVLLIHGFTGTPYDLKPLALALNKDDYFVSVPLLSGHGAEPKNLLNVKYTDWIKDVDLALKGFHKNKPKIVIGLSMGALLAIILAKKNDIDALVLLSPSLKLRMSADIVISLARLNLIPSSFSIRKMSGESDIADSLARIKSPAMKEMPIFGLLQLDDLRKKALKDIEDVHCPTFIGFGKLDSAIDVDLSRMIAISIGSSSIECREYNRSKHVLPLDFDRDILSRDVLNFLNKTLGI